MCLQLHQEAIGVSNSDNNGIKTVLTHTFFLNENHKVLNVTQVIDAIQVPKNKMPEIAVKKKKKQEIQKTKQNKTKAHYRL